MNYQWGQGEYFGRIDSDKGTIEYIEMGQTISLFLNGSQVDCVTNGSRIRSKLKRLYSKTATASDYRYFYDHIQFGRSHYNKEKITAIFMEIIPEHFL